MLHGLPGPHRALPDDLLHPRVAVLLFQLAQQQPQHLMQITGIRRGMGRPGLAHQSRRGRGQESCGRGYKSCEEMQEQQPQDLGASGWRWEVRRTYVRRHFPPPPILTQPTCSASLCLHEVTAAPTLARRRAPYSSAGGAENEGTLGTRDSGSRCGDYQRTRDHTTCSVFQ